VTHYIDLVYGSVEIDEAVLLDLLQTRALKRLDTVLQHGITGLLGITQPTTRLEHSLGVMVLVRRLGATLKEQIAALLHDASHTAFSHVIDYVFNNHDVQGYHEEKKEEYLASTDIPLTLASHGYDWRDFLHEEEFPLLEQPSPALCADRLDYFLRDSLGLGLASSEDVLFALTHLDVHQGRIAVNNLEAARWMGYTFIAADQASWANFREVGLYELAARAIRTGLKLNILTETDLWSGDKQAWNKLLVCADPELQAQLKLVSSKTQFVWDQQNPTFLVSTKLRTIDPSVLVGSSAVPLSTLDSNFAAYRHSYLTDKAGLWPMRVIPSS